MDGIAVILSGAAQIFAWTGGGGSQYLTSSHNLDRLTLAVAVTCCSQFLYQQRVEVTQSRYDDDFVLMFDAYDICAIGKTGCASFRLVSNIQRIRSARFGRGGVGLNIIGTSGLIAFDWL